MRFAHGPSRAGARSPNGDVRHASPPPPPSVDFSTRPWLLCFFDEFPHVTEHRSTRRCPGAGCFFRGCFRTRQPFGVATSNVAPRGSLQGGSTGPLFLPFYRRRSRPIWIAASRTIAPQRIFSAGKPLPAVKMWCARRTGPRPLRLPRQGPVSIMNPCPTANRQASGNISIKAAFLTCRAHGPMGWLGLSRSPDRVRRIRSARRIILPASRHVLSHTIMIDHIPR